MLEQITAKIMMLMEVHGPMMVFLGVIVESVIVPIPSPLIIMGAGAILIDPAHTFISAFPAIFFKIVLPGALASTIGAYFTFLIAYWGGKPAIDRWSRFIGFSWNDVLWMEKKLEGRVNLMVFLFRALPVVPLSLISAAVGVLRLPWIPFTIWTFLGSIPRCLILGYLGFLTRDTYVSLAKHLNSFESYISVGIVIAVCAIVLWLRHRVKKGAPTI